MFHQFIYLVVYNILRVSSPIKQQRALVTIQEVVQKIRQQSPHKHKFTQAALICAWKAVMHPAVCKRTTRIFYKQDKLFVQLSAAPLRQELQLNKQKVLDLLQAHVQDCELLDVVLL